MNKQQQEIKNSIGQLEASIDVASKYMTEDVFSEYCDHIHAAIAKLRVQIHNLAENER